MNIYHYGRWPLFSDIKMTWDEKDSNSEIFKGEGNTSNEYVAQSAKRYDFNINEAVKETLSTINVQVAVWIFLATYAEKATLYYNLSLDVDVEIMI